MGEINQVHITQKKFIELALKKGLFETV